MPKLTIPATLDKLSDGMIFIQKTLKKNYIKKKPLNEALLICEEAMVRIITNAEEGADMQINIRCYLGTASVTISAKGKALDGDGLTLDLSGADMGHDSEEGIRSILLHAYADKIAFSRKGDYNFVKIAAGARERFFALRTLASCLLALLVSIAIKFFVPADMLASFSSTVLVPMQQLFLNALQLVTAPAVFFCVMTSVARFSSFSDPGKISGKIMFGFVITTVIAIGLGVAVTYILPVPPSFAGSLAKWYQSSNAVDVGASPLQMLVTLIPDNVIAPFSTTNCLQLLVISALFGVALGKAGQYTASLNRMANALEKFFSTTVTLVSMLTPFAVFFVTLLLVFSFGLRALVSLLIIVGEVLLAMLAMFVCYMLILLIFGRLNPITFIVKFRENLASIFWGGSSVGAIPDTMKACENKLGVSPLVTRFSIPLGAIANLDGNCIYLAVAGLLFSQLCGIEMTARDLVAFILTIMILSLGSPITPGSAMLALTMLMKQQGISLEVLSIILALNPIIEMVLAACNTAGDVATTLVVARNENLVDKEKYYAPLKKRKKVKKATAK
ncbi:MAG: dicarboxylate/amino acid:cation symporter [Oscillospiraceae bacterium]|nr:dicarboxylate/amino acid:cation symporter [Candidatus Equicaccousia limihippi]